MEILLQENLLQDCVIAAPPHSRLPRLDLGIDWVPRWEEFRSSLRDALTGPRPDGNDAVSGGDDLRVEWMRNYRPGGALMLAAIAHVLAIWLLTLPIWGFLPQPQNTLAPLDVEVNWYVPTDLPAILLPAKTPAHTAARTETHAKDNVARGADAYHPRQTILSVPVRMTHPRQTLIRPDAPMQAPKLVEQMPNIVQWAALAAIQKPTVAYSTGAAVPQIRERQSQKRATTAPQVTDPWRNAALNLAQSDEVKLAPPAPVANDAKVIGTRRSARVESSSAPQIAATRDASPLNLAPSGDVHLAPPAPVANDAKVTATRRSTRVESAAAPQIADASPNSAAMNLAQSSEVKLGPPAPLPSSAVPVAARHDAARHSAVAPELGAQTNGNPSDVRRLIALSANPAPPAVEVRVPQGNLAANVSISPDGTHPGTPSGADRGAGAAKSSTPAVGSGANSLPAAISISSASAKTASSSAGAARPDSASASASAKPIIPADGSSAPTAANSAKAAAAKVAALPPGAEPEKLLTSQMFTLHISTPNTTSTRGSWLFHFAQLGLDPYAETKPAGELAGPIPTHTIDPRYPPDTVVEHIRGEVVLYAIIRKDGSVDSVQVVRSLDPRLDKAAVDALAQWQFRPGARAGMAVDIEAVIHVPFEYRQLDY